LSLSEIELKACTVKPNGMSLTRSPFNLIHNIPCCVGMRTVRFEPAGALLILAVEEKPDTAKPLRSAAGISDVKQYLNLPLLSRIDARFCSQSRIITSVLGKTATLHVGLSKRRTRRDNLLLCSYILVVSEDIDGGAEDDVSAAVGEIEPFPSIGNGDVETLPFSELTSLVVCDSSTV
jgi:hypothetical protein